MNPSYPIQRAFMLLPLLGGSLLLQAQNIGKQVSLGFDEVKKLTEANQFGAILDYVSTHPFSKWPKIYSAEFCAQKLKGKEQALRSKQMIHL